MSLIQSAPNLSFRAFIRPDSMTGQAPVNYMHDAGNFGDSNIHASGIPVHNIPLDLEHFLMDQNPQNLPDGGAHMPQTQFIDFSYPFADGSNGVGLDVVHSQADQRQNMFGGSARGSFSEHRGSIVSIPGGRASFSSNGVPMMVGHTGSLDGSDGNSPENARQGVFLDGPGVDTVDTGSKSKDDKDDLTPAWSELKTKAGKERKRLPLACIACRRKKIRCSGEKPACKHCLKSRIPCVYKVTTRKAAPRTDYMAMLDKRLKRMEDRIIKIVPKDEQDTTSVTRGSVKPLIPGTVPVRTTTQKKRAADEAFGAELEAWARPNMSDAAGGHSNILRLQEAEETRLLSEGAEALPPPDIQEHLAEVFFDNLYGQAYHLLHKPSYMRKLRAGTVPPVLILAVCGISARFSTHPQLDTKPAFLRGEQWAKEAREIVMRRYDWPNITILTCLLLLGLHEFGTCYGGRSWALGGMAVRMAFALQLHKDLEYDPLNKTAKTPLSFVDREIRRRTMWACFLMDRFNSSGTDRPMVIREETVEIQLPICEKFFQLDMEGTTEKLQVGVSHSASIPDDKLATEAKNNMGVAAYMIRAISLHGRITLYLFQGGREKDPHPTWHSESHFAALEKEAESFSKRLPSSLQYSTENLNTHETEGLANQFLFLHICAQRNIMSLNHYAVQSPNGGLPPSNIPVEFVGKTTSRAFDAGKQISQIIMDSEAHSVTAPFAGHCAVISSVVQMAAAFSKNPAVEQLAKRNLATNVRFIAKMKRFWGTFHYLSENLREQFRACADAANQGPGALQAPVFQYGDWFDRYPHGVSQSDFEDPATTVKTEKGDDAVLEAKSDLHTVEHFFNSLSPSQGTNNKKKSRNDPRKSGVGAQKQIHPNDMTQQQQQLQDPRLQISPNQNIHQMPMQMQLSPTDAHRNIFVQPANPSQAPYYPGQTGQDLIFPPQQHSLVPQLDRQLVFGAYDGSATQPHLHHHHQDMSFMDMGFNTPNGGYAESSAWFMPFNMEPPNYDGVAGNDDYLAGLNMAYPPSAPSVGTQSVNGGGAQHGMGGNGGM